MITSALISELRREYRDVPKSTQRQQAGDGATTLFNLGVFPIIENSYTIRVSGNIKTEITHYTLDKDNGDLNLTALGAPGNGVQVQANLKYANFRDQHWVEAINRGIDALNGHGFFRQISRATNIIKLSANIKLMSAPSAAIDVYELFTFTDRTTSGSYKPLAGNWNYQQDSNKIILGFKPIVTELAAISYLRNLQTYQATSATLDFLPEWKELVKIKAGEYYFRDVASKIAQQGAATIDEGHLSFSNARGMAEDLEKSFEILVKSKKPTRPAKEMQFRIPGGGF